MADRQRFLATAVPLPSAAASYLLPSCAEKLLGSPGTACPTALLLLGKPGCSPWRAGAAGDSCGSRTLRAGLQLLGMGSRRRGSPLRQAPSLGLQVTCFQRLMLERVNINQKRPNSECFQKILDFAGLEKVKSALSAGAVQPFHPLSS